MTVKELRQKLEECDDDMVVCVEAASSLPEEISIVQSEKGKFRSVMGQILQDNIILLLQN
jgi:hypothetical protein